MSGDPRVLGLLEEMLDGGKTPEEACRGCPELLAEVRERWREFRRIDAGVVELLPGLQTSPYIGASTPLPPAADLPQLPEYELLSEVGCGGMGVVYRARDLALDRDVAVKLLQDSYPADSPLARRFTDEARITAQLQHPGVPAVYRVGTLPDGRPFLAMKLIKGRTLAALLGERPDTSADPGRFVATFEQVCQAVGYAHAHDVIHRDLKPSNVMVGAFGEVQVMDWGLAKVLTARGRPPGPLDAALDTAAGTAIRPARGADQETQAGSLLGTPAYMPPEQAIGAVDRVDARSDVFSLGGILCAILTGRPPYVADTTEATRQLAARARLDDAHARLAACGAEPELVALCRRCLAPEPDDRPRDAGEVAAAVAALRAAADERARRAELERVRLEGEQAIALARSAERRKRRRLVAGAAGLLAVVLVLVTVASLLAADYFNRLRLSEAQAAQNERWLRYRSNLAAAGAALQLGNTGTARRALEAAPPELRAWEWLHFTSQLDEARLVLSASRGKEVIAFRPDGQHLAAGETDGTVRLWDAATGRDVAVLDGRGRPVRDLAFDPDGRRLLVFWMDGTLRSWDESGKETGDVLRIPHQRAFGAVFSPDRRLLFAMSDHTGRLWDLATGRPHAEVPGRFLGEDTGAAAFAADGRRLAYSTGDDTVHVWDLESGAESCNLRGHTSEARALAFSPDGKRLATGAVYPENCVRLWDLTTGSEIAVLRGHRNAVFAVVFSPDGSRLVSSSLDQTARLWDGVTGRAIAALKGHRGFVNDAAFRPDGKRVVTSSHDGTLRIWDASDGEPLAVLHGHTDWVGRVVFSPDGGQLASQSADGTVRLWDMALAERRGVLRGHSSMVYDVTFSPDGTRAVSAAWDGTVRLWDLTTGRETGRMQQPDRIVVAGCFSPDGKQVAAAATQFLYVWDAASGRQVRRLPLSGGDWRSYPRAAFHPRGKYLAAGGGDGAVRLWGPAGEDPVALLRGHEDIVSDVAFRPDGVQLASAGVDHAVRLWDVETRSAVAVLRGHTDIVHRVAFSADGRLLASASTDKTVRLWNAATHDLLAVLPHGSMVYGVAFRPDGTRLASCCADNTIRLWDVAVAERAGGREAPDAQVAELHGHDDYVHAVDWSPDGTRLISASGDGTVRVWDSLSAQERAKSSAPGAAAAPAPKSPGG
jgi:WD40 repeat protein/serine/threonine protein kinase